MGFGGLTKPFTKPFTKPKNESIFAFCAQGVSHATKSEATYTIAQFKLAPTVRSSELPQKYPGQWYHSVERTHTGR